MQYINVYAMFWEDLLVGQTFKYEVPPQHKPPAIQM